MRPEILFPLFVDSQKLTGVGPKTAEHLATIGLTRPRDLIFHLPHSVIDRRPVASLQDVEPPSIATVRGKVISHQPPPTSGRPFRVFVEDGKLTFQVVFFHAHPDWVKRNMPIGSRRVLSGKVEAFDGAVQMVHPEFILPEDQAGEIPQFQPVYPLTAGVTAKTMAKAVHAALARVPKLREWADTALIARKNWPSFGEALTEAHAPRTLGDVTAHAPARERLAYDELFAHQMTLALARARVRKAKGVPTRGDGRLRDRVTASLPYQMTAAQIRSCAEIAQDMGGALRMNRLLQGDVGAGKTLVAFMALLVAVEAGGQGAMMAPTEILARQHMESLSEMATVAGVRLALLTGRDKGAQRAQKLAALKAGQIDILIGTHALFQSDVDFHDLRLAVIDEQHRFGVSQRMELGAKGAAVDILVMTATPIPRSLALAQYGDMDVSMLDEKPPGRQPIQTALVSDGRLDEVIEHLKGAVAKGQQAYWVCPLVSESEQTDLIAAEDRFAKLRAIMGEGVVDLVHGQMPPESKDAAMARFAAGHTSVLVATTVIEVGVNVPNATIMVIERAERFGLAQLHQLRGRVGRGNAASTCLLMFQNPLSEGARRRLNIMRDTEDGFVIAEEDLQMRGAGDLIGTAQAGLPRFQVADLESQAGLMQIAQKDAQKLLADDPALTTERGKAARTLLWLTEQDRAIRLIEVG